MCRGVYDSHEDKQWFLNTQGSKEGSHLDGMFSTVMT